MNTAASTRNPRLPSLVLAAGMALVGWYLLQRTLGLSPGVFADEWYYSKMARLMPLSEATLPSWLYLLVFGATSGCGPGFLDCARIGNVVFHVGAAPFLYLVARRLVAAPLACAIALLSLLLPLNLYTSFFMPESMYFFGFALLAWVALNGLAWRAPLHALAAGAVLGLMSLVKVHAVFLLPALCLYLVYAGRVRAAGGPWIARGLGAAALALASAVLVKLLLGWLLAGEAGLTLFGAFYGAGASSASQHSLLSRLYPMSVSARGHATALTALLAIPLAILLHAVFSRDTWRADNPRGPLVVFTVLALGSALGLAVLYTASIAHEGPMEGLRLHSRYYSFALPLLLVAAAATAAAGKDASPPAGRRALAPGLIVLVLAALLAAAWIGLPAFDPRLTDSPEYTALARHGVAVTALFIVQALLLALWLRSRRAAAWGALALALPLALLITNRDVHQHYLVHLKAAPPADRAGMAARALIPPEERSATMIVANGADLFRTQFHIDHPQMILLDMPDGAPIEAYRIGSQTRWLVAVGRHSLPEGMVPAIAEEDFTIVKLPRPERSLVGEYAFNVAPGPGRLVVGADGVANVEAWGRWSDGKRVELRFDRPLPARLTVVLTAGAFGANIDAPFVLRAGDAAVAFRLPWEAREVVLDLDTDGRQQTLVIEVPQPQRPSELGNSTDTRLLGISLTRLRIEERTSP